jgi:hypothetical protein
MIWEMSGPRMLGTGFECNFWFTESSGPYCTAADLWLVSGDRNDQTRRWLSVDIGFYGSLGNEQKVGTETIKFEAGRTWMLGLDPIYNVGWRKGSVLVHHGLGVASNFMFGDFRRFVNGGVKLRPVSVTFNAGQRAVEVSLDVRWFPREFEGDPTRPNHLSRGDSSEWVPMGIVVGFPLSR